MSLHDEAITWLASKTGGMENHKSKTKSYKPKPPYKVVFPDVIQDENTIHEVEVLDLKKDAYKELDLQKHLWIVIRGVEAFNDTKIVFVHKESFYPLLNIDLPNNVKEVIHLEDKIEEMKKERKDLTEYLESYDMNRLKELRKKEQDLEINIKFLMKQQLLIEGIKKIQESDANLDRNCPACPFYQSWLRVAYKKAGLDFQDDLS